MTERVIIYPNETGGVAVVMPAIECGLSVEDIARKDVPAGVPYMIVDASTLPRDLTFFDAWEADFSAPDGYGVGQEAWFAERSEQASPVVIV